MEERVSLRKSLSRSANSDAKLLQGIVEREFEESLLNKDRRRNSVDAKRVFSVIMRERNHTCSVVGRFIYKDHSTVCHYERTMTDILQTDRDFKNKFDSCRNKFFKRLEFTRLKREAEEQDFKDQVLSNFQKKINAIEDDKQSLEQHNEHLMGRIKDLKKELNNYNTDLEPIHKIIRQRTKPGTTDFIEKKLNAFYNGVYTYSS
jgi:DNA repair exonuclease SbcCD ATPase subunit